MSVIGEAIAVQLVSDLAVKTIFLGYHVIRNSKLYIHDADKFQLRLETQLRIWEAINSKVQDPEIARRCRPADLVTYFKIMKELHSLVRKYIKLRCQPGREKDVLLATNSAHELVEKLEETDVLRKLSEVERAQSWRTWSRISSEASWTVSRKARTEKLILEIESWGNLLDKFASQTIPGMFQGGTAEDIWNHVTDQTGSLVACNAKSDVMLAQRMETMDSDMSGMTLVEESSAKYTVDYVAQLKFLEQRYQGPYCHTNNDNAQRSDLGGIQRRQWADFKDLKGNLSRVIVEFKALPTSEHTWHTPQSVKEEANALVRTLRVAAQKSDTFRVLFCHGWYEESDHFGLVYQLPSGTQHSKCESLGNILLNANLKDLLARDIENRIKLAKALAWTMFELHSVDWLHKSFHPDNILLFGSVTSSAVDFDWSAPYVVGFDSSRSQTGVSGRLDFKAQWINRVYTHPDRQIKDEYYRYQKLHDIYSLGMVLLELGRLDCFTESRKDDRWSRSNPHQLKDMFVQSAKELKRHLGSTYREVVLTCLNGDFPSAEHNDEYLISGDFRSLVCEKLDQIKI
jgi:hypothetical protein